MSSGGRSWWSVLKTALGGQPSWSEVDHAPPDPPAVALYDHWTPASDGAPLVEASTEAPADQDAIATDDVQDDVANPIFFAASEEPCEPDAALDWTLPDLPFYDPGATGAPATGDVFARPHAPRTDTRAGLLARATSIPDSDGRARAASLFADMLDEFEGARLFQTWLALAPSVGCPRALRLAIELRTRWVETPRFWRYRTGPGMPSKHSEAGHAQYGWSASLSVANVGAGLPAEHLLDEDWVDEWEELDDPCPGFWNFAAYARIRAEGDEAETAIFGLLTRPKRARRALHTQELCEGLGSGRSTGAWNPDRGPSIDRDTPNFNGRMNGFAPGLVAPALSARLPTKREMTLVERDD